MLRLAAMSPAVWTPEIALWPIGVNTSVRNCYTSLTLTISRMLVEALRDPILVVIWIHELAPESPHGSFTLKSISRSKATVKSVEPKAGSRYTLKMPNTPVPCGSFLIPLELMIESATDDPACS